MLAGDARDASAGARVRRAVDAQLRRAGIETQDAGDVRTEVVLALLSAPAAHLPVPLELACARAAVIARHKAIDHGRRTARAPLAHGDDLPEPPHEGTLPGSLDDGLDEVTAQAHRRRVRGDLVRALAGLDAPQRAAIGAHAEGGAARAAGLPRSTYYRALAHAQARLRADLRGRLAGLGALGDLARGAREFFAHAEATHAAAVAVTATAAVTAAVGLSFHDTGVPPLVPSVPIVQAQGGRSQPAPPALPRARALTTRVRVSSAAPAATAAAQPVATTATASPSACTYDPSTYDC